MMMRSGLFSDGIHEVIIEERNKENERKSIFFCFLVLCCKYIDRRSTEYKRGKTKKQNK